MSCSRHWHFFIPPLEVEPPYAALSTLYPHFCPLHGGKPAGHTHIRPIGLRMCLLLGSIRWPSTGSWAVCLALVMSSLVTARAAKSTIMILMVMLVGLQIITAAQRPTSVSFMPPLSLMASMAKTCLRLRNFFTCCLQPSSRGGALRIMNCTEGK